MSTILLLEDDSSLGATLQERLTLEKYQVEWAQSLGEARDALKKQEFDLAIFDLGLPDGSGFEMAKELKEISAIPFIFVTAASDAENRLAGFELGAEEFIPKPFHLKELLLRVKHVLDNHAVAQVWKKEQVEIDFSSRIVSNAGETTHLAKKEFELLKLLIDAAPRVVSREEILDKIWGEDQFPTQRTVDNVILKLRQAFGESGQAWIKSVRGVGYQWIP